MFFCDWPPEKQIEIATDVEPETGDGGGEDLDGQFLNEQYCYKILKGFFVILHQSNYGHCVRI